MSIAEKSYYAPFNVEGLTPGEEEEYEEMVERSIASFIRRLIDIGAPEEVFEELFKWLELQEEEYAYEKDLIRKRS